MSTVQLNPHLLMRTPLGTGYAKFLRHTGEDFYWTVFLTNGAIVEFRNDRVKAHDSYTDGRWNRGGDMDTEMKGLIG